MAKDFKLKFVDVDPDVQFAQWAIIESRMTDKAIAEKCGCAPRTVGNIRNGATVLPRNSTLNSVCCKALGFERVWTQNGQPVSLPTNWRALPRRK